MANDFVREKLFDHCISLGWFCGTASALSKLGLRSRSGPFDWCFSYFWAVMDQIKNGFKEFMRRENLRKDEDKIKNFSDIKYGFYYNHDIKISFEQEYPAIFDKYMRRIDAFMKMIKHPTVFFRCVRDEEEIKYINENWGILISF